MPITASHLRGDVYRILDNVIETGESVEIERKGKRVKVVPVDRRSKLHSLPPHACIKGDPESLVHIDWSAEWREPKA